MRRFNSTNPIVRISACMVFLFISSFSCHPAFAADKTYKLTLQSAFPMSDPSAAALKFMAEDAAKRSSGSLQIKVYGAPEIVPEDQLLDAVNSGVLDMMHSVGVFHSGVMPVGDVEFGLPMAYNIPWEDTYERKALALKQLLHEKGLIDILRAEYAKHGHYYIDAFTSGPTVLLSTKKIKTFDDFKGMKIRCDGLQNAYYGEAGAKGTYIAGTESYMALKLGTVDAAEWDVGAITGLGWYEVAPYWISGMESYLMCHITIQKKKWDGLPKEIQSALTSAAGEYSWDKMIKIYKEEFDKADELIKTGKLKKVILDDASKDKFFQHAQPIWNEVAKKDAASAKAIENIRTWIKVNQK